jgi:hypothetical protein
MEDNQDNLACTPLESVARMFEDITNTIYDTLLIFQCYGLGIFLSKDI